ncbi:unnamed protein product [Schistosoma mattheei]|uniref:ALIX_LYPXL_bnd domain-containing protein n=1 Tax=Schistosoma mattheei TaxID=31246 RepID=A0AA85AR57_9TREM|nr:unnamed protein product [Schistosoma mattheei]
MSCCCQLSQSIDLNGLKSSVGKIADYEKKLGQGIQLANTYLGSNNLPKLSRRQLQSKLMQGVQSYGQQQQPMQQQQQPMQQKQQQSQQQQPQQQQSQQQNSQQQQPQQQQYYSSNMMMKRQMGGKINHNSQQPMSAYSQYSNSYGAQSGYGQPIGQSQMMKRQYQSKLVQAYYPSQQGQQQQQLPQQYGYPPIQHYMQMGGVNMQPEQFPYFQQPQYYDNIGFDENQQDSYEPVDGPYVYDDNVEEPVMGDVVKRELM